jgi:FkbM family methyltransferase
MNFKALVSSGIRRILKELGYDVHISPVGSSPCTNSATGSPCTKPVGGYPDTSLEKALHRLSLHAIPFNSLIDVGASNGSWSKTFAAQFSGRRHLLIDANRIHLPALEKVCQENHDWDFRLSAVGGKKGTFYFDGSDPLGGHLSEIAYNEKYQPCPVNTIDDLLQETELPGPYFLKLDTHGVEIPILQGAKRTLENTNVLVIEAYNFTFGEPAVPFWELCRHLSELGYRPLDVFDLLYREVDNAFWQFDLLFARSSLPLFQDPRYFIAGRH